MVPKIFIVMHIFTPAVILSQTVPSVLSHMKLIYHFTLECVLYDLKMEIFDVYIICSLVNVSPFSGGR